MQVLFHSPVINYEIIKLLFALKRFTLYMRNSKFYVQEEEFENNYNFDYQIIPIQSFHTCGG